jgi:hypothetical protein
MSSAEVAGITPAIFRTSLPSEFFDITLGFFLGSSPGADDPSDLFVVGRAIRPGNDENQSTIRWVGTRRDVSILSIVMGVVVFIQMKLVALWILQNFRRGLEGDAMLPKVTRRFLVIPFK